MTRSIRCAKGKHHFQKVRDAGTPRKMWFGLDKWWGHHWRCQYCKTHGGYGFIKRAKRAANGRPSLTRRLWIMLGGKK